MREMYFDVWAGDDLLGTSLGELTDASDKKIQVVDNGMGLGEFTINRHSSQYDWVTPGPTTPEPLIRVRRVTGGPFDYDDARYIHAFFVEEGSDVLLSPDEEGGEDVTRRGGGAEAILTRAVIDYEAHYVDDIVNHPYDKTALADGQWHFTEANPQAFANVGTPGAVLRVLLRNAGAQSPEPMPELVHDFNINHDSDSVPWQDGDAEWSFDVGTDLLTVLGILVNSGLYYRMSPALVLSAWVDQQGTDLSGSISFIKADTTGQGIADSSERTIHASPAKSRLLVEGDRKNGSRRYRWVADAGIEADLGVRQGFLDYEASSTNAILDKAGLKKLADLKAMHDGPPTMGVDEVAGQEAFIDYFPGDTVTVTIPGVYTAEPVRIHSITLTETETGEADPILEFGGETWVGVSSPQSATTGGSGLILCHDTIDTTTFDSGNRVDGSDWGTPDYGGSAWNTAGGTAAMSVDGTHLVAVAGVGDNASAIYQDLPNFGLPWQSAFVMRSVWEYDTALTGVQNIACTWRTSSNGSDEPARVSVYLTNDPGDDSTLTLEGPGGATSVVLASNPPPNTPIHVRWDWTAGSVSRAKVWWDIEPVGWMVSRSDSNITTESRRFQITTPTGPAQTFKWDYIVFENVAETCIVGGPNATSGDPNEECNHKAAPCDHDHRYTSAMVFHGDSTVADALDDLSGTDPAITAHIADTTDAHDASAVSIADAGAYYTSTDVEGALQEIGAGGIGGGGGGVALEGEVPAGTIDGSNDTFTLSTTPTTEIVLFKNGLLQREGSGNDYTLAGNTITYEAGNLPLTGDTHFAYLAAAAGAGGGSTSLDLFGDGQDGSVTINSGTFSVSVGGSALITNNVLQRDAYFQDLTLNGGDLVTNGRRVFVAGTLTMTSGVIRHNGGQGSGGGNGSGAAGGGAGGAGGTAPAGTLVAGVIGLPGTAGGFNAAGAAPTAPLGITVGRTALGNGAAGGASGQGQAGGQRNTTATLNTLADRSTWTDMLRAIAHRDYTNTQPAASAYLGMAIGGGGGGGAAASGGGGGGGSGASGGPVVVVAATITGTTDIQSLGGNGGNGGNGGGTNAGGGGGGGGGSGGWIVFVYHDNSGWSGSLDVSSGTGGTGGTGIGTGSAGGNGPNGNVGIAKEWAV